MSTPQFVGRVVGNYRILEMLGSGGMGAVYRAEDMRLGRQVALKLLLDEALLDTESLERFRREVRAASALHHPHICTVFDAGEDNGVPFLAMELLEGHTLAQMIAAQPIRIATILTLTIQICDGLQFAHEKGFIHRDLKPSNIFVTTRGDAKLLDFGLAKHLRAEGVGDSGATLSTAVTQQGQLLGTAPYMSPEQAEGAALDVRSDIFSLGAVLYEMATGVRAFPGESAATILAGVMRGEPRPPRVMNPEIPGELQRIIARAMEKEQSERYQSAKELTVDLRRLLKELSGPISAGAVAAAPVPRTWLGIRPLWFATALALVAAAVIAIALTRSSVDNQIDVKQITFSSAPKSGPLLTDGSRLYFGSREETVQMAVSGGMVAPMRALGSGLQLWDISADASKMLVWKPDPEDEVNRGTLLTGPILGGALRRLNNHLSQAAKWSSDGQSVYFADLEALYVCSADGGNEKKIWSAPATIEDVNVSPDGKELSVSIQEPATDARIWIIHSDGSHAHRMMPAWPSESSQSQGRWTSDQRHFIFMSNREGHTNLYELASAPWFNFWRKPVAVRITGNEVNTVDFVPARDGKSLFALEQIDQGETLVFDPHSNHMLPYLNGASLLEFAISPDRQWMAYSEWPSGSLWKSRLDGSEPLQLTDTPAYMFEWSPDGKAIAYSDWSTIYVVSADGGQPEQMMKTSYHEVAPTWSADGRQIYFNLYPIPNQPTLGIRILDLATRKITMMPGADKFFEATWSPDHKHLVALANNPSRMVIYTAESGKWTDLTTFKAPPGYWVWSADSKVLYMDLVLGQNGIYRLSVPDGKFEKISELEANTRSIDSFLSLSPDGQPAIMSHTGVPQVYSLHSK